METLSQETLAILGLGVVIAGFFWSLHRDLAGVRERNSRLEGAFEGMRESVARLYDSVERLHDSVKRLHDSVAELRAIVAGQQVTVAGLQGDAAELKGNAAGLRESVVRLEERVDDRSPRAPAPAAGRPPAEATRRTELTR